MREHGDHSDVGTPLEPEKSVTFRALLVGVVAVVALTLVALHCTLMLVGSLHSWDLVLETSVFLLMVVVVLNGAAGLVWRRARMGRGELTTVFLMILAGAPAVSIGFMARLLPALGALSYYEAPENRYGELIAPNVPSWILPQDRDAVRYLFQGLPKGMAIPWRPWVAPLLFWCGLFLALALASIFLAVLLRRQWIERERLAYPIVAAAIGLIEDPAPSGGKPIWRGRMLWAGIGLSFLFSSLYPLSRYIENYVGWHFRPPRMNYYWFSPSRAYRLRFKISWAILGLTYLIPLDVSLSCWLFNLIYQFQTGLYNVLGFDRRTYHAPRVTGGPALSGQAVGAFLFIGVSSLWMARRHLAAAWRSAWSSKNEYDDSDEIVSYRVAVFGFLASSAVVVGMLCALGTPPLMALLVFTLAMLSLIAMTKIAIHCGLGWMDTPFPATSLATDIAGIQALSPSSTVSLGTNWIWSWPMRITEMGTASHGLKVADQVGVRRRELFWALLLGVVVALIAGAVFHLWLAYEHGGINFYGWFYRSSAVLPWSYAQDKLLKPHGPRWRMLAFSTVGVVTAGGMQVLRHRFVWWPFSVVGYAGAYIPTVQSFWFDIFLVWIFKRTVLKYGGPRLYHRLRPFFIGLLMGFASACGLWYIAYLFTGIPGGVPW